MFNRSLQATEPTGNRHHILITKFRNWNLARICCWNSCIHCSLPVPLFFFFLFFYRIFLYSHLFGHIVPCSRRNSFLFTHLLPSSLFLYHLFPSCATRLHKSIMIYCPLYPPLYHHFFTVSLICFSLLPTPPLAYIFFSFSIPLRRLFFRHVFNLVFNFLFVLHFSALSPRLPFLMRRSLP